MELHFAVNHLGPFLLTYLLMPLLRTSAPCTVIIVTSNAYEYGKPEQLIDHRFQNFLYTAVFAYAQSKLANVLFAYELKKRMKGKDPDYICLR